MRAAVFSIAFVTVSLFSELALACPVCFSANAKNRAAYFITFVFLTLLPLSCIGSVLFFLRKRARAQQGGIDE